MLRRQTIEKLNDERFLFDMLRPMAMDKSCQHRINLTSSEINSLRSEISVFYKEWLQRGYVGKLTSHSKYSFVYAEKLANVARKKLLMYVHSCRDYAAQNGAAKTYGYGFTVNPKDLHYHQTNRLNRKIVGMLRKNKKVMLIQKEIENTYYHCGNNVHFQYFVLSAQPLPHRKIERAARRYGKQITGSVTKAKLLKFDDIDKAVGYATKQYGLPLPLKHRKNDPLDQFQHFMKLPINKRMHLLAADINGSKGIERHRMYVNRRNETARNWWDCLNHSELMPMDHAKDDGSSRDNKSLTLFGVPFDKIYRKAHRRTSKHHYSQYEHMMQLYHGNVDLAYHHKVRGVQTKLF